MGRHRQFEPNDVLDRAMTLFWDRGYDATSVDDLVKATGVNRASLYASFGDKKAVFMKAFQHYLASSVIGRVDAACQIVGPRQALLDFFDQVLGLSDSGCGKGCLITNTAAEFGTRDGDVLEQAREALAAIENAMDRCLRRAQAEGDLTKDADIRLRARHLLAALQGLLVLSKVNPDKKSLGHVAQRAVETAFL